MQTFLPYPDFAQSVKVLDYKRLGKQRLEAKQLLMGLEIGMGGWYSHPASKMWRGHEQSLALYGAWCCSEWQSRGYVDNMYTFFAERVGDLALIKHPRWLGDPEFHRSHQSNLVRKLPEHYRQFFPEVPDDLPYVWPSPT